MEDTKIYTVFISFGAKDMEEAKKFVLGVKPEEWLDYIEEEE